MRKKQEHTIQLSKPNSEVNFSDLPPEVHLLILMLLNPKELSIFRLVSRYFLSLGSDSIIWKAFFYKQNQPSNVGSALELLERYERLDWYQECKIAYQKPSTATTSSPAFKVFRWESSEVELKEAIFANDGRAVAQALQSSSVVSEQALIWACSAPNKSPFIFEAILDALTSHSASQKNKLIISPSILGLAFCNNKRFAAILILAKFSLDEFVYFSIDEFKYEYYGNRKLSVLRAGLVLLSCDVITQKMLLDSSKQMRAVTHPLLDIFSLTPKVKSSKERIKSLEKYIDYQCQSNKATLLHLLAENDDNFFKAIELQYYATVLIKNGVNPEQKNGAHKTPLETAVEKDNFIIAKILLANGAKFDTALKLKNYNRTFYLTKIYKLHKDLLEMVSVATFPMVGSYSSGFFKKYCGINSIIDFHLDSHKYNISEGADFLINDLCDPKLSDSCKIYLIDLIMSSTSLDLDFCRQLTNLALSGNFFDLSDEKMEKLLKLYVEKSKPHNNEYPKALALLVEHTAKQLSKK